MKLVHLSVLALAVVSAPAVPVAAQSGYGLEDCLADCAGMFGNSKEGFLCRKDCYNFYGTSLSGKSVTPVGNAD
jgi:hypothetical protein